MRSASRTSPRRAFGATQVLTRKRRFLAGDRSRYASAPNFLAALLGVVALTSSAGPAIPVVPVVTTQQGRVTGAVDAEGTSRFLGIPFAAPPVGALRWRAPQPPASWKGLRINDHFSASCMQDEAGSRLPWTAEFMTQGPISEDCLYVNVWTTDPDPHARRAVMVWIYGGGFGEGSSAISLYDGAKLARLGVVLVSFNYRVGPFGFFVHPELSAESADFHSGNYGLLDQIAALQWVKRNIAAFGGDPARVTIFGQSAGAMSVKLLMESPLTRGLFARAIAQSGPGWLGREFYAQRSLAVMEQGGTRLGEVLGATSAAALRALPAAELLGPRAVVDGQALRYTPTIDGNVVRAEAATNQVPLLFGIVSGDALPIPGFGPPRVDTLTDWQAEAGKRYGERVGEYFRLYPAAADAEVTAARNASLIDCARVALARYAKAQHVASGTVYAYYFDRAIPWPQHPEFGAFHTGEVPYVFRNLSRLDRPWTIADRHLADVASGYWVRFAKTGNPNASGLPPWPEFSAGEKLMRLGDSIEPINSAEVTRRMFCEQTAQGNAVN